MANGLNADKPNLIINKQIMCKQFCDAFNIDLRATDVQFITQDGELKVMVMFDLTMSDFNQLAFDVESD